MPVQFLADPGMSAPVPAAVVPPRQAGAVASRLLFQFLLLCVLGVFGAVLYREFSYVYCLRASVMGDIVQIKAPDPGTITAIRVKDGDEIAPGQLLFELDDSAYRRRLVPLQKVHDRLTDEVEAAAAQVEEYKAQADVNREMNVRRLRLLQGLIDSRQALVKLAKNNHERTAKLRASGASHQEADTNQFEFDQNVAQLVVLDVQKEMQEYAIEQTKNYRVFSGQERTFAGFTITNSVVPAKAELAKKRTDLEQAAVLIADCENQLARCKVFARFAGRVKHVSRLPGDHVTSNDYVLGVLDGNSRPYVAARFTTEDAKYLFAGADCTIIFPARNLAVTGKVTSIGHSGLNATGAVSVDEETSLAEVPVKIALPDGVDLKGGEGAHVKVRRNWSLNTWLQKLY